MNEKKIIRELSKANPSKVTGVKCTCTSIGYVVSYMYQGNQHEQVICTNLDLEDVYRALRNLK